MSFLRSKGPFVVSFFAPSVDGSSFFGSGLLMVLAGGIFEPNGLVMS